MRTLVVGAGAVGGFFGAHLAAAGRDVTFLVREQRARILRESGLTVTLLDRDLKIAPQVVTADAIDQPFDLVVVAVKGFGLPQALDDLASAVGSETAIVPLLNGLRHIDVLHERFGGDHVLGGLCLVATQLADDGSIRQLAPGACMTYGELDGSIGPRVRAVDTELSGAGFDTELTETIRLRLWEKWLLLASGGALTTLLRGTVGDIEAVSSGSRTARSLVAEFVSVATAAGFPPRAEIVAAAEKTLTRPGSAFTTSTYRDLLAGNDVEAEQIIGDLVVRANALGIATPLLAAADAGLEVYRAKRSS